MAGEAASALAGSGRPDPPRGIGTGEHLSVNLAQFRQRLLDVAPLTLQQIDLLYALLAADRESVGATACAGGEHVADLGQSESEPFALQNESKPVTVRVAKDAGAPVALGREQTFALVKSQCTQCHSGLARKLADG